ncbi:MAG: hypothetical protein V4496_01895 [Pseudomonadota bacterium]
MKKRTILAFYASTVLFLAPNVGMSIDMMESLATSLNPGPSPSALNILYQSMEIGMKLIAAYYQTHHECPEAGFFSKQPAAGSNIVAYVANGANCSVIGQFSQSAPGPLKNGVIRMVVKVSGPDSSVDFSFRLNVTNIGFESNGFDSNIFQNPLKEFSWSPQLLNSNFGPTIATTKAKALTLTYTALEAYSQNAYANVNTTGSSDTSSVTGEKIVQNFQTR